MPWQAPAAHFGDDPDPCRASSACRRAYQRYRERQRLQKEDDRRTIEAMDRQICALQAERSEMSRRIDVLQKVIAHLMFCTGKRG